MPSSSQQPGARISGFPRQTVHGHMETEGLPPRILESGPELGSGFQGTDFMVSQCIVCMDIDSNSAADSGIRTRTQVRISGHGFQDFPRHCLRGHGNRRTLDS